MDLSNNSERLQLNDSTQSNPILHSTLNETQANRKNDHKKRALKSYKRVLLFEEPKLAIDRLKEEFSDSSYVFRYTNVRSARKQVRASKNVRNAVRSSENTSKSTPVTTSASTSTSKAPICGKRNAPMKKKNGFYCPNKCKKS